MQFREKFAGQESEEGIDMIVPSDLASTNTEHAHQTAFFCWVSFAAQHGFLNAKQICLEAQVSQNQMSKAIDSLALFHAIPNGGHRDKVVAAKLKAEGVKAGVFDTFLPVPMPFKYKKNADRKYSGLYIEFKAPARRHHVHGGLSAEQRSFMLKVQEQGYFAVVCYTWQEAANMVMIYYNDDTRFEVGWGEENAALSAAE